MTGLYLRLSLADKDLGADGKDESNSIENQRALLYAYLGARKELTGEVREYIDDGYSGTNFKRPAFLQMLEDAKRGKLSCILVKDLSRLGRDYIAVGDYMMQIFPLLGVRFIAVNSHYDSSKLVGAGMDFELAVSNLINTFYSRDLSKKLKSANETRWKQGISTSAFAPFGYVKDWEEKGKLRLDPEAAEIVRLIFDKALEGWKTSKISEYLNAEGYPTPRQYFLKKQRMTVREERTKDEERLWTPAMVLRHLRRYEYTGALVMGKTEKILVGSRAYRKKKAADWTVVEGMNEGIVTKDEFDKAQAVIGKGGQKNLWRENVYALKGKARCGNCRYCLSYDPRGYEKTFHCGHSRAIAEFSQCCRDKYSVEQVDALVWFQLKQYLFHIQDLGGQALKKVEKRAEKEEEREKGLKMEINRIREESIRQYERYVEGEFSREAYMRQREKQSERLKELEAERKTAETLWKEEKRLEENVKRRMEQAGRYAEENRLTREAAEAFIKNVYVYSRQRIETEFCDEEEIRSLALFGKEALSGQS